MKKLILLFCLSLACSNVYAATYYFSTSGSNSNPGTFALPYYSFYGTKDGVGALSADDICLFKAGDIWYGSAAQIECLSSGTDGHPIVFDRYGTGNDPKFYGSSVTSTWTLYSGSIWKKTGLSTGLNTVGVDGTYALGRHFSTNTTLTAGTFLNESGTVYIRLSDSSDPNGHTIYCPGANIFFNNYVGNINAGFRHSNSTKTNGDYVEFNHLQSSYNNRVGFSSSGTKARFNDCTAIGNSNEGFLFRKQTSTSCNAQYTRAYRCTAQYNNVMGSGYGQAYTSSAPYTFFINCTAEYNKMAGFDLLDYNSGTDASYSGVIYCISRFNGQTKGPTNTDPGIYIDGAHDVLVYGNQSYGAGVLDQAGEACNILVSTETSTKPSYNVHVVNNLAYNSTSYNIRFSNGSATTAYGHNLVNNTMTRGSGGFGGSFIMGTMTTPYPNIKNNLILRTAGSDVCIPYQGTLSSTNMDYSDIYDYTKTTIVATSDGNPKYDMAGWKTYSALEANGISSDPLLVDTTFATFDAHLQLTSPAINTGMNTPWTPPAWITTAGVLADNGAVVGTTRADGVVDSGTLDMGYHYYAPTPTGSLTSTNVQPATLYLNTANTDTITFTTATAIPSDGKIVITYPISLGGGFTFDSGGTSAASFNSGGSGTLTVSRVSSVITLTRSGGSAIAAGQAVSIALTHVLNPPQAGSTGPYQIKTTTSADASIDIDTNVSADQIIAAPATFTTITINGVVVSNLKIQY